MSPSSPTHRRGWRWTSAGSTRSAWSCARTTQIASASTAVPLADFSHETWVEDNEGPSALLRTAAARAGFEPRIDLAAADLTGKTAMVAAGHAVALVPGVLAPALRRDVVAVSLADPPTRGIYASLPAGAAGATSPPHRATRRASRLRLITPVECHRAPAEARALRRAQ